MILDAGTKLGRYEIRSKIGEGGMGEVYLAEDTRLHRKVALKILPGEFAANKDRMRRFEQEAQSAAALNHPNIAHIYEIGEDEGTHFIAMEFIDGVTLREKIHQERNELRRLLRFLQHAAEGLALAHAAGIVHRDLKPDNIMITRDGHAKILDFGLAKLIEPHGYLGQKHDREGGLSDVATALMQHHSTPGTVLGTVGYMSPEQAQGKTKEIDHRSDIFSFGCILFEAATGRKPFEGESVIESLHKVVYEPAPPIAELNPSAPAELQRIVRRCLAKDADERYQSIKDVAIELKELRREMEAAGFDTTVPPPPRSTTAEQAGAEATPGQQLDSIASTQSPSLQPRVSSAEYVITGIKRHKVAVGLVVIVLVVLGASGYYLSRGTGTAIDSICVLPLVNASDDPNTEYLSDGISEALINSLTELQQLKVIARSTAFRYKGKEIDPQTVGRELNVRAVLMGRVRQIGDRLDIQVDLVDASTRAQLWGEEYERQVSDVLSIKQAIAREVTDKLRLKLSGEQQSRLTKRDTTSEEAYQFYLRGRYYWNKRTAENLKKAIQEFKQAIDRDPNFALGYVGVADCYLVLQQYAGTPANEALPQAKAAIDRALQIDETLAEAHASLASANEGLHRWAEAESEFRRAIGLNPNYATAHHWFALYHLTRRQFDDALSEMRRAQELDPLSPIIGSTLAMVCLLKNNVDSARELCRQVIELEPNFPSAHLYLGWSFLKLGRNEEATAEVEKAVELSGRASFYLEDLGYLYAVTGRRKEAVAILKELQDKNARGESSFESLAAVNAGLGDNDQVFALLEKGLEAHDDLTSVIWWFDYDAVRGDPRYADLLRRMGLNP